MKYNRKIVGIIVIIAIAIVILLALRPKTITGQEVYSFKGDSFYYSQDRGKLEYTYALNYSNDSVDVYNVQFKSRNFINYTTIIYGLLFLPKSDKEMPGIVFLAGGGVTKDMTKVLSTKIAKLGYAVLSIDQRGLGQTGGYYLGPEQDYEVFAKGFEPTQHLSVYDGLRASDVLREFKGIDKNSIAISGESMGARYALIAAAQDKRLKGVIAISASGFHFVKTGQVYDSYIMSIDPDNYIDKISPNKLFMLQGDNDTVVKLSDAQKTFDISKEPKKLFIAQGCSHGYCDEMYETLKEYLKELFG